MKGRTKMGGVQESGSFEPIPEGVYYVKIADCQDGFSPNGDPMIAVKFVITQGKQQNSWVWDNIIISDNPDSPGYKILGRTKHFLHIIGEPYEDEIVVWDTDNWIHAQLRIVVYHDEYPKGSGKKRAKISEHLFLTNMESIPVIIIIL